MSHHRQPGELPKHTRHGLGTHALYGTWRMMMERCYNSANRQYVDYGGRGLVVETYLQNVVQYINYIESELGARPLGGTVDRIDNSLGYERGNLRWASREEQNTNQRVTSRSRSYPKGSSGYRGVTLHRRSGLWRARCVEMATYHVSPESAAHDYDRMAREHFGAQALVNFQEN